jgi:hypothetical protein
MDVAQQEARRDGALAVQDRQVGPVDVAGEHQLWDLKNQR